VQDAPQHEICVHRERRMKEYVMPTHAPKKEMPAMMSINTSDPESSGAIFKCMNREKDERCTSDQDS
jgi:hypothetical protein